MSRTITTEQIRNFLADARQQVSVADLMNPGPNSAACMRFADTLIARCDALDETPQDYGFEFVVNDGNVGREGVRDVYYAYRYAGPLPDGCTSSYYILAPDDGHPDDATVVRFIGEVYDDAGEQIADSDDETTCFETMAEVVAWFNEQLGGEVIKRVTPK